MLWEVNHSTWSRWTKKLFSKLPLMFWELLLVAVLALSDHLPGFLHGAKIHLQTEVRIQHGSPPWSKRLPWTVHMVSGYTKSPRWAEKLTALWKGRSSCQGTPEAEHRWALSTEHKVSDREIKHSIYQCHIQQHLKWHLTTVLPYHHRERWIVVLPSRIKTPLQVS